MTNKPQDANHWINEFIINLKSVLYKPDREWIFPIIHGALFACTTVSSWIRIVGEEARYKKFYYYLNKFGKQKEKVQTGQEATLANRQYEVMLLNGERHYAETACTTFGVSESVHSSTGTMSFNEWVCPFIILYSGKTKAFFDRDYAVYRFMMDNMKAQNDFTFINNKYGSEIQNAVFNRLTQENIAMTQAKAVAMMKERSTSYRTAGESTGFDWGKEWGDDIYDRNTYRTEDGGTIQAATSADGVW